MGSPESGAELLSADGMLAWLHDAGEDAGSDYNDGDDVLGWFGWKITGDVLTITHERDIPRDMVSRRWRLVPLDTDEDRTVTDL